MIFLLACAEPIDLPEDKGSAGVPVGVQTLEWDGLTLEVWYPTSDDHTDVEEADILQFVPDEIEDIVGGVNLPPLNSGERDAPLRKAGPYPVVLFSHGLGGYRLQSLDLTVHWASRGYVVVAADHPGRRMQDILPCMFSPALDGCGVEPSDPGPNQIKDVLDWVEQDEDFDLDPTRIAMTGHSAGAATTAAVGEDEDFDVLLPMASAVSVDSQTPTLLISGDCDAYAPEGALLAAGEELLMVHGAGHLAFADFCELELGAFADELAVRDDINRTFLQLLRDLATDGCPGYEPQSPDCEVYFDLPASKEIIRYATTAALDHHLREEGPGVEDLWEETTLY